MAGQIDEALELVKEVAPSLLQPPRALNFRLQCCKFMHMVSASPRGQAVQNGPKAFTSAELNLRSRGMQPPGSAEHEPVHGIMNVPVSAAWSCYVC